MKHYEITRPIGLRMPCAAIELDCDKAHVYKRCGLRPGHLIVPLDSGNGRTTFIEYMADMYRAAGVLDFISGLDDYIEITLDGSLQQLKQAFAAIDAAAVYTNEYCNIIGMDISGIASHMGETQFTEFLRGAGRVCESACVVFFVHNIPTRNEERLLEKLCEAVENIRRVTVEPYTQKDICALVMKCLEDHGIEISGGSAFYTELQSFVERFDISDVKGASAAAESLIFFADFSGFTPVVDVHSLKSLATNWNEDTARREMK